jgi:hypothetical protein
MTARTEVRGGVFKVHTHSGHVVEFKPSKKGLYYLDVTEEDNNFEHMLVNMVQENFEGFMKHKVEKAKEASCLQGMIGNPTKREYTGILRVKLITNCPVTVHDINNANRILGPNLANIRGKMTRTKPEQVRVKIVQIHRVFVQMHKYVMLVAGVMFINSLPFVVTSSRGLNLVTIDYLPSRITKHLVHSFEQVFKICATAGSVVQVAMMDIEFEKLKDLITNVTLNTTAAREHVGEIEQKIRVIKERARGTMNTVPYATMPKLMVIKLLHYVVMWMNSFPVKSGISKKWSTREFIPRQKLDVKLHRKAPFGSYCKVRVDPDITNTMEPRTKWAICLGPTGNRQGSYRFLLLMTGSNIVRRNFTEIPVTESAIKRVNELGTMDKLQKGRSFKNRSGLEYEFGNDEEYKMAIEPSKVMPFLDNATEAPGMLNEQEKVFSMDKVAQEAMEPNDQERAKFATKNSGRDFSSPEMIVNDRGVIKQN